MRSIAFLQRKGGVGKTTLATNLAVYLAVVKKLRVEIADLDPQASAFRFGEERRDLHPEKPSIRVVMAHPGSMTQIMERARRELDVLIIDTPAAADADILDARAGRLGDIAAAGAHLILIPCKPYLFDTNAMVKTARQAQQENRKAFVVFNEVEGKGGQQDVDSVTEGIADLAAAPNICEHHIRHNVAIPRAAREGLGVVETVGASAAPYLDMKNFAEWVLKEATPVSTQRSPKGSQAARAARLEEEMRPRKGRA